MITIRRAVRFAVFAALAGLVACATDSTDSQIQAIVNSVILDLGLGKLTVGQTLKAQAILHDAAGSAINGMQVSWASSNTNVASVTTDGTISAVSPGTSDISASAGGHSAHATLTVLADNGTGPGPVVATQVIIVQQPTDVMNGVTITPAPSVELRDAGNNRVAGADQLVTATIASGTGTIAGNTAMSVDGVATFPDLRIAGTGAFTVSFGATGLTPATSNSFNVTDVQASQLSITTQPSPTAQSGVAFAQQPSVQALDASGSPVARSGIVVTVAISSGGGTLGGTATATTNSTGVAAFTNLSISGTTGARMLTFASAGLTSATSNSIVVGAGAATALSITTQPSSAVQTGVALAQQPAVQLRDALGNAVGQSGVQITAAIATGGGTLGGTTTAATNASGLATFTNLAITGVGTQTLSFTSNGLGTVTSTTIGVTAGPPSQLSITTQPSSSALSGSVFAQQPVIQLRDAGGNAVSQSGVAVTVSILTGGGTLGGTTSVSTDAGGVATFSNLSISGTAGSRTLSFAAAGFTNVSSSAISVSSGSATKLAVTTQPSSTAQVGAQLAQQPSVQLRDASNNNVAQAGVLVTVTVSAGSLTGTTSATTTASGVATFANLAITGTPGTRTLTFASTGLTSATSSSITVSVGVVNQVAITTQPGATANSAVALSPQPAAKVTDVSGNAISGATVTAAISTGSGTLGGTATATTNASGVATFTNLSITGSGSFTLAFTSSSVVSPNSSAITVTAPATATKLAMSTQPPASVNSAATFTAAVRLQDASSNNISQSGVSVTVAVASGSGTLGGTKTVTTNATGIATFSTLTITGSGAHTLTFTSGSLTAATSSSITVNTPPPATNLGITTQPSASATTGQAFGRQPVIQLRDASNAAVSQSGVVVTAAIATGGGTLGGTATATTNASGVATFTNLSISGADGARTLSFSAPSLTSATSSAVTVTAGPPSSEPVFDPAVHTMAYQDNMDSYTSADAMGAAGQTGPRITPNPSPMTTSSPVQTTENALVTGRDGTGKALRLQFSGGNQTSATFITWNMPSTPTLATHYFQYWARVNFASMPFTGVLAVKWFEAWHVHTDRVQWNTHDHLPCQLTDHHPTYWQVYDQSRETTCQANQPVGPYFNDVADNQWHRFTYEYRPNSSAGARDGVARMWVDGVKVIDVSAAAIGVIPSGGEWAWCNGDDVDNLAVNDGMFNQFWGSTQTTNTPSWTYDVDDYKWWYKP